MLSKFIVSKKASAYILDFTNITSFGICYGKDFWIRLIQIVYGLVKSIPA